MPTASAAMPPEVRSRLEAGAQDLGVTLTAEQLDKLLAYLQLIQRWTQVYNLTAVRDAEGIVVQHLLDSLAVLPALRRFTSGASVRLLDVGSGAGLPGLPLAVAAPELRITCIDAVAKKAGFMSQAIAALALNNALALHGRVEALSGKTWDVITSRAFGSLADFVRLTEPLVATDGCWLAMKGKLPTDEIAGLPGEIEVFHVEHLRVPQLEGERCVVWLRRRSKTP